MDLILKQGVAATIVFPLITTGSTTRKSGATLAAGDFKILRHTAAAWNVANPATAVPVEIGTTGLYALPLTATELTPYDPQYPIIIACHDAVGAEWEDTQIVIRVADYSPYSLGAVAAVVTAAISGSTITVYRGDSISINITGLGSLANVSKLYFTVKARAEDADTAAIIQVEQTDGLKYINGVTGTAGNGTLTITNPSTGAITITLTAAEAAKLPTHLSGLKYDVQIVRSAGVPVSTLAIGDFIVSKDYTRAVS
jgi:hypothetical protein